MNLVQEEEDGVSRGGGGRTYLRRTRKLLQKEA